MVFYVAQKVTLARQTNHGDIRNQVTLMGANEAMKLLAPDAHLWVNIDSTQYNFDGLKRKSSD